MTRFASLTCTSNELGQYTTSGGCGSVEFRYDEMHEWTLCELFQLPLTVRTVRQTSTLLLYGLLARNVTM